MNSRTLEVVLRGGKPWGFTLSGGIETGSALYIAAIEPGGKACRANQLRISDNILAVNDITVTAHHDAVQAICSAFGTLTLSVKRGHTSTPSSVPPSATQDEPAFTRRHDTPDRTQDDSQVFTESKAKGNGSRRPKRRGASFNLRSNTGTTAWTQPVSDSDSVRQDSVQYAGSVSSVSEHTDHGPDPSGYNDRVRKMYSTKSTPSLQYYTEDSMEPPAPPGVVPSQSWHSSMTNVGGDGYRGAQSDLASDNQLRMKKSTSYSHAPSVGQWDNAIARPYRKPEHIVPDNKENLPSHSQSQQDIRHGYSASFSGSSSVNDWQRNHSTSHLRNYQNVDGYRNPDSKFSGDNYQSDTSAAANSQRPGGHRPVSPPQPPVRDASSLRYIKVSQSHEKYPSWPVTQATVPSTVTQAELTSDRGFNSRTNSWSDTTHTNSEFPNKPRMAYQPQLNTHTEERKSPKTMKRYLQENRIQSPKDRFNERVARELRGVDVDIKKDFPLDSKGKLDMSHMTGSDPSYPLPQLDKDGRYKEDKNYAIPSPPQRDISPVRYSDGSSANIVYSQAFPGQRNLSKSSVDSSHNGHWSRESGSPTLPDNSQLQVGQSTHGYRSASVESKFTNSEPQSSHGSHDISSKPSPTQSSNYPYVVRNRAFYNTSTQTDTKSVEVQVSSDKSKAQLRREEKSVQARPGSIVAHQQSQQQQRVHSQDNDYERLVFNRETEQASDPSRTSICVGTSDIATSPGPLSPRDHRALILDRMEHNQRIPETISENEELLLKKLADQKTMSGYSDSRTLKEDVLAQIQEHSQDDTVMLRRLSQDFFRGQGQYGVNSRVPLSSDNKLITKETHGKSSQDIAEPKIVPVLKEQTHHRSKSHSHLRQEDTVSDLPKMPAKDQNQYFNRNKSANMSLRKAYGIFEEVDTFSKAQKRLADAEANKLQEQDKSANVARTTPPKKTGKKSKSKKNPDSATRETKIIAEKARKEYERSGNLDLSEGRLRRTTSEQIRPLKERAKDTSSKRSDRRSHEQELSRPSQEESRRKSSDPASLRGRTVESQVIHHKQASSSDVQKVEDFLCNSPLSRQRRMPSDSDSMPPVSHIRHHSSNRSSSSTEEHSRNSDPELKKFQQQALLGFYDKKSGQGKRLSSGAADGSVGETPITQGNTRPLASPSARSPTHKSVSLPRDAFPAYHQETKRLSAGPGQESVTPSSEVPKHGHEVYMEEDMPSPPLLDTTKELSPAKASVSAFPFTSEYSPPPHPWKESDCKNRSWSLGSHTPEGSPTRPGNQQEQVSISQTSPSEDETHPKAIEAMMGESMSSSSGMLAQASTESSQKYAYQITVNKNYSATDDGDDRPPTLPPRNYRANDKQKSRPSPKEPPERREMDSANQSSDNFKVRPSSGERRSGDVWQPESKVNLQKHVSQVNVRFTSDYDATPKVDSYADQLRQQARRISQSQSSLLNAARYQNKPVPETKTSISSSRPVDKPPGPQEARTPSLAHRSMDTTQDWNDTVPDRNPLDNIRATAGPVSPRSAHSASNSFDSSLSVPSPRTSLEPQPSPGSDMRLNSVLPNASFEIQTSSALLNSAVPSPSHDSRSVINPLPSPIRDTQSQKSPKDLRMSWEGIQGSRVNKVRKGQVPEAFADNMTPPPPYPPKNISSDHHQDERPLPSPPKDLIQDGAEGDGGLGEMTSTPSSARYSADSYLYNKGTTRQGFGGNYHRSGDVSPTKPLSPGVATSPPSLKHDTSHEESPTVDNEAMKHIYANNKMANQNVSIPLQALNKPHADPPWNPGKRTFYPAAKHATEMLPDGGQHTHTTPPSAGQMSGNATSPTSKLYGAPSVEEDMEQAESPSVKACIANFENWSPRTQRKFGQASAARVKVSGIRDVFVKRSNENLNNIPPNDLFRDRDSLSSRSRSNESLEERTSTSKSTENLTKATVTTPSTRSDSLPQVPSTSTEHLLEPKPTSPTLESGYNSHTPDNRSIISELSLSSGASGSNQSRQGSNVSKDSIDLPTSQSVTVVHVRQKSIEEIECDKHAAMLVSKLSEKEKQQLSEVILPPPQHKTSTDYMSGLFDTRVDASRKPSIPSKGDGQHVELYVQEEPTSGVAVDLPVSSSYWSPPSIAQLQSRMRQEGLRTEDLLNEGSRASLQSQKVELLSRIERKIAILKDDMVALETEIDDNNCVGKQVAQIVEQKAKNCHEFNKFKIYLDELDTVLKLLLKVSGQLARAENALMSLPDTADSKEKRTLTAKRDDLSQKHEDAKQLKEGIDLRSNQVAALLRKCLTEEEFDNYEYFVKMKSKLKMEHQDIEDKITLGQEQLSALKKSLAKAS